MGKKLSDEELLGLASMEFIGIAKAYRDGSIKDLDKAFENTPYADELIKRGMKLQVSRDFIHRIFTGEFDNVDGVEVGIKKVGLNLFND